jgi:REP element-mobilizing transposase RayT
MPRLHRATDCCLHHVTSRGNNRRSIYEDTTDRETFYDVLEKAIARTDVLCHVDVQMGNHYHLLVEGAIEDVSEFLWRLNHRYAVAYNQRHGRINHMFGRRFHCGSVEDEEGARAVAVYVSLNPVRAGFCEAPAEWPFGSFRAHAGLEPPRPHLSTGFIAELFGPGQTLSEACDEALARDPRGRPSLHSLLPRRDELTREHVKHAVRIFGYTYDEIARHYGVSLRTLQRWLAE